MFCIGSTEGEIEKCDIGGAPYSPDSKQPRPQQKARDAMPLGVPFSQKIPHLRDALRLTRMVSTHGNAEVFSQNSSVVSFGRQWVALALLMFTAGCSRSSLPATETPSSGEWRAFQGSWSASGVRQTLNLEPNHRASIFDLTGTLLLTGDQRLGVGFQARAIGLTDSLAGMQGRCVWTDERGDKIYSELKGEFVATGNHIVGTFLGGTGRYAGMTGEYSFQWQFIVESEDGTVSGRAVDLKGRARIGSDADISPGEDRK
jgi:hypothetical protein